MCYGYRDRRDGNLVGDLDHRLINPGGAAMIPRDGGPAFPSQALGGDGMPEARAWPGMSLRVWLAGMALAEVPDPESLADASKAAELALAIADAILEAIE